jgi:hypothetical protein
MSSSFNPWRGDGIPGKNNLLDACQIASGARIWATDIEREARLWGLVEEEGSR